MGPLEKSGGPFSVRSASTVVTLPIAVILGLEPRIERRGALLGADVAQADNPILGSSPRMTASKGMVVGVNDTGC